MNTIQGRLHTPSDLNPITERKNSEIQEKSTNTAQYRVDLSEAAKDQSLARKSALDRALSTDPLRQEKITALKEKVDAGRYRVDAEKVADGILHEALFDDIALAMHHNTLNH